VAAIEASDLALPMGHWKGADLALLLDLLAALLTGGQTTVQIGQQEAEYGVAQVFDYVTGPADHRVRIINEICCTNVQFELNDGRCVEMVSVDKIVKNASRLVLFTQKLNEDRSVDQNVGSCH
jgi:hypothetical protein